MTCEPVVVEPGCWQHRGELPSEGRIDMAVRLSDEKIGVLARLSLHGVARP